MQFGNDRDFIHDCRNILVGVVSSRTEPWVLSDIEDLLNEKANAANLPDGTSLTSRREAFKYAVLAELETKRILVAPRWRYIWNEHAADADRKKAGYS